MNTSAITITTESHPPLARRGHPAQVGSNVWHLLEMLLAMGAGIAVFYLLVGLIPASSLHGALILLTLTLLRLVIPFGLLLVIGTWLQWADRRA